jgi:lipooligosaccharide transport system permease protein
MRTHGSTTLAAVVDSTRVVPPLEPHRRFLRMTERNIVGYARAWPVLLTGIFEPFLYLLSIGIGVGALVGDVAYSGRQVPYETFVASGMLATAAMNGAVFDTTFNFFIRLKYAKLYDAVLSTPLEPNDVALGEVTWALLRGAFYSSAFLLTMVAFGLTESWWTVLALPVTILIGAAFASVGLAASTYMRSFLDFDFINLAITPMFLFSATFFPLEQYPDAVAAVVRFTPLYQGVALCRALTTGEVDAALLWHVAYLGAFVLVGVAVAGRRIDALLRS